MCNIVEEYVAERLAEVKAETEAKLLMAKAEADKKATPSKLDSIKNLMKKTYWSAEEAMDAIGIPKADYTRYLAML